MDSLPTPSTDTEARLAADLFALAHPARLAIVRHLAMADACCTKDVVGRVGLAQSTVSQHLKVLVDAGLVRYAPDRQRSRYSLDPGRFAALAGSFRSLIDCACGCGCARPEEKDRTG